MSDRYRKPELTLKEPRASCDGESNYWFQLRDENKGHHK